MNILLIGMRGSGKSTIGKLLAKKIGLNFVETDELIEKLTGTKIIQFIRENGWEKFRDVESNIIERVSENDKTIISTGGGVVARNQNMLVLKKNGYIIYLKANIKTLLCRVGNDKTRPFLTAVKTMKEDLEKTLSKRKSLYEKFADHTVITDDKSTDIIVDELVSMFRNIRTNSL